MCLFIGFAGSNVTIRQNESGGYGEGTVKRRKTVALSMENIPTIA
jgi:hypothetical protein